MSDVIGRMHASEQKIVNNIKFEGKKEELEELSQSDIKLLKLLISKPAIMRMLINYPNAAIKDGLFDCAYKVIKYYGISIEELICKRRDRHFVQARRDYCHLAMKHTSCTRSKIARFLKRDHTMIIHYLKKPPINLDKIDAS